MKKLLTILMVCAMMSTAAVTSFAADSISSAPAAAASTSVSSVSGIELGADINGLSLDGALLTPGEEYRFPIQIVTADGASALTDEILEEYNVKLGNTGKGSTIASASISTIGDQSYLILTVKAGWPTETTEEQYSVKITKKGDKKDSTSVTVDFRTGYAEASDAEIDKLTEGDEVVIDNAAPVYTEDQLNKISKINRYKKTVLAGDGWTFTVNITDNDAVNMIYNDNPVKEILTKYEDQSFAFVTFPSGPKFRAPGSFVLDVSDYEETYNGKFFVYRYLGGKLTAIPAAYSEDDSTLTFSTDTLGRFVITDKEIGDAVVLPDSSSNGSLQNPNHPQNPSTGADPFAALLALSSASILASASLASKKRG